MGKAQAQLEDESCLANPTPPQIERAVISDISIEVRDIFEPPISGPFDRIYNAANNLHIKTRNSVVQKDLLFKTGELVDIARLRETERRLRSRRYYSDAKVWVDKICGDQAKVHVAVKDVWTLEPQFQFTREGDDSSFGFGLEETNFLGLGKTITISKYSNEDRTGTSIYYADPNTGFYDSQMQVRYANNDDGEVKSLEWQRPFTSLETKWSAGLSGLTFQQNNRLFNAGEEINRYQSASDSWGLFYGRALAMPKNDTVNRLIVGYQWLDSNYAEVEQTVATDLVPGEFRVEYPWIEIQRLKQQFIEVTHLEEMNRVEDINLGYSTAARLGWTQSPVSALNDRWVVSLAASRYLQLADTLFGKFNGSVFSLVDIDNIAQSQDTAMLGELAIFWNPEVYKTRTQTYFRLQEARLINPLGYSYLEAGASLGARGYPARFQIGDRRQLITLEQRFYGSREWFSLVYVGSALFYDASHVWGNAPVASPEQGWLQSIGFGLRISSNRLSGSEGGGHGTLHIDVAAPIDENRAEIDDYQLLVSVKKSF